MKNYLVGITTAITIILVFAFWWYEWRPTQIRKNCFNKVQEMSGTDSERDRLYSSCVMLEGVKP